MIDVVGNKLIEKGVKFLTIHDSFVVNSKRDVGIVKKTIKEAFIDKYGASPSIATEAKKEKVYGIWKPTYLYKYYSFAQFSALRIPKTESLTWQQFKKRESSRPLERDFNEAKYVINFSR